MDHQEQEVFPNYGLSIDDLKQFIEQNGGRSHFENKTTREVVTHFIIPLTLNEKIAYYQLIHKSSEIIPKANVYVIHSWNNPFLAFIDDLINFLERKENPELSLFIDIFCINQHLPINLDWISKDIPECMKSESIVVVYNYDWIQSELLQRSWCLWEIYSAIKSETKLEYCSNQTNLDKFHDKLLSDAALALDTLINKINISQSISSNPAENELIHQLFRTSVSHDSTTKLLICSIFAYLIHWIDDLLITNKEKGLESSLPYQEIKVYLQILSSSKGKDYIPYQKEIIKKYEDLYGKNHAQSLRCQFQFALLNFNHFGSASSLPVIQDCYERSKIIHGLDHRQTLILMYNLGTIQSFFPKKIEENLHFLEDCLKKHRNHAEFGERHTQTLAVQDALGACYSLQNDHEKAAVIFRDAYEKSCQVLGEDHADTLGLLNNLALSLSRSQAQDEAEPLFAECLRRLKRTLGHTSPDYMNTLQNRARNLHEKGGKDAQQLAEECYFEYYEISKQKARASESNSTLVDVLIPLASGLQSGKVFDEAERVLLFCRKYCENGHQFPFLQSSENSTENKTPLESSYLTKTEIGRINQELVSMYQRQGKYDEAEPLGILNYQQLKELLGAGHASTLTSLSSLAYINFAQGKFNPAIEYYQLYLSLSAGYHSSSSSSASVLSNPNDLEGNNRDTTPVNQEELSRVLYNLGLCYEKQKNFNQAKERYQESLIIREQFFGKTHAKTVAVQKAIDRILADKQSSQCLLS